MSDKIEIQPLRCGSIEAPAHLMEAGGEGMLDFPVWAFLITHPSRGRALFDVGMHPRHDGRLRFEHYRFHVPAGHDIASQLEAHGVAPGEVPTVVLSHIHSDHVGGMALVPNARIVLNRAEEEAARGTPNYSFVDHGHDKLLIDGDHDLFGDGSVEVLATPGHTCGHQSLRVRRFDRADVLAGDACYFCRSLARDDFDQPSADIPELYVATKRRLQAMQAAGDFVVPGHDEAVLAAVPADSNLVRIAPPG